MKISALVFSKDDTEQALELIKGIHDFVDEVVVLDASGRQDKKRLVDEKQKLGLTRLEIVDTLALGFREPLMMYALTKCNNDWVLLFNSDERPSDSLRMNADKLVEKAKCGAFAVGIFSVHSKTSRTFVSWQVRLFDRTKTEFRGMLHEEPFVKGRIEKLDAGRYFIDHFTTGMKHTANNEYVKLEMFERYTYRQYNDKVLDQFSKIALPENRSIAKTRKGKVLSCMLNAYERIMLKKQDKEVSNLDYFCFRLARDVAHQIRRRRIRGVFEAFPTNVRYVRTMRAWRCAATGKEDFEIAKEISKIGVIRFLGLDKPSVVEALYRKYKGKSQGIDLLISLLRENTSKTKA